jgi:3-phenylpropionate/cinnamic acid dioxygenase small subunit
MESHDPMRRSPGDRAAAELEIRNVLARLAQLADSGDTDAYVRLLTDDITWAMPPNPAIGLAGSERHGHGEIATGQRERMEAGQQGPRSNTMHTTSTVTIHFESDDAAKAESAFVYWGETASTPVVRSMGRYVDDFRRTDEGWKLARREITFGA